MLISETGSYSAARKALAGYKLVCLVRGFGGLQRSGHYYIPNRIYDIYHCGDFLIARYGYEYTK